MPSSHRLRQLVSQWAITISNKECGRKDMKLKKRIFVAIMVFIVFVLFAQCCDDETQVVENNSSQVHEVENEDVKTNQNYLSDIVPPDGKISES